jgi:Skp family chaperone for outer membrane proteins
MFKLMAIGGLAALAATYAVTQLVLAQGQPAAPPAAAARIAVVNIEALMQNYKKAQIYNAELEKELKPLRTQAETLRQKIIERQRELRIANLDAAKRKQWEEASNKDMKKLDELEGEAARLNNQKIEKELVPIYKEMLDAVKAHARTHGIHIVLSYAEDPKIDPFSRPSIERKVTGLQTTGCVTPLYVDAGADITAALTDVLNRRFDALPRK